MRRETIVTCQSPFHPFAGQETSKPFLPQALSVFIFATVPCLVLKAASLSIK
jgi:hypothetical protein